MAIACDLNCNKELDVIFKGTTPTFGLYYVQNNIVYLCNRDTGIAVYNPLNELVGIYVEVTTI